MHKKNSANPITFKSLFLIGLATTSVAQAQVKVGNNPATPAPSAALEVESDSKGFLPPRMLEAQMMTIVSPATGLMVYCLNCTPAAPYYYNGTSWLAMGGGATAMATYAGNSLSCGGALAGSYSQGSPVTSGNTKTLSITVGSSGTYSASTNTQNGVSFAASGTLLSTGTNIPVTLTATGTPSAPGAFTYTASLGGQTCTFSVTFSAQASFNCANITNTLPAPLTNGQAYNTGSITVPYTSGNGSAYGAAVVGPVSGLSLTRTAGTFASGSGNVVYNISGTYTGGSNGLVTFMLPESGCAVSAGMAPFSAGTLACTGTLNGTYQAGAPTTASNTKAITVTNTTAGGYSFSTNNVNGVVFAGSGSFNNAASQTVTLVASGTPLSSGNFSYTLNVAGQTCAFSVTYGTAANYNCASPIFSQTPAGGLANGTSYTGSYTLPYTAGNSASYGSTSQIVDGLTFTRTAGTYLPGGGNVVYNLSGTYTGSGNSVIFTIPECGPVSFPSRQVSTVAGAGNYGFSDGPAAVAEFNTPQGITTDAAGNIYVGDRSNNRIRRISTAGVVATFAGNSAAGLLNGTGTGAQFKQPAGLAADTSGNIYVADRGNNVIRKISSTGVVSTLAGDVNGNSGNADGPSTVARFNQPEGVTVDVAGNVYVADLGNHRIRMITPMGAVTTIAGSSAGYNDATGAAALFNSPNDLQVDRNGNLFVTDRANSRIRKVVIATGAVTTIAGGAYGYADANGVLAQFREPTGITLDGGGNIYVTDYNNFKVRKISPAGDVTTVAGSTFGFANGPAATAQFTYPYGITIDGSGNILLVDQNNNRIRKITP